MGACGRFPAAGRAPVSRTSRAGSMLTFRTPDAVEGASSEGTSPPPSRPASNRLVQAVRETGTAWWRPDRWRINSSSAIRWIGRAS